MSTEHPEVALARARLALMVAATTDPVLSDDQLTALLAANRTTDADGRRADHADWFPSYQLGAAAEDGWLLKAGMVAARVDGGEGALRLSRSQLHAHCLAMAERYSMRRGGSLPLAPPTARDLLPVFNRNDPSDPDSDFPGGMAEPVHPGWLPGAGGAQ